MGIDTYGNVELVYVCLDFRTLLFILYKLYHTTFFPFFTFVYGSL